MAAPESPSSRRAWIEIYRHKIESGSDRVALLAEGVDRNLSILLHIRYLFVALLAEGVDRNTLSSVFAKK